MSLYLSAASKRRLLEADDHRCAYCHTSQVNSGHPMVVDHILPRSKGGTSDFENLCYACYRCNLFKHATSELEDPLTSEMTALSHPRQHTWSDHFVWSNDGIRLLGLTAIGRVTIIALNMNNDVILDARRNWLRVGWHPPAEDLPLP